MDTTSGHPCKDVYSGLSFFSGKYNIHFLNSVKIATSVKNGDKGLPAYRHQNILLTKIMLMKQKFTPNQLVKYIYKESSVAETLAIQEALQQDFGLFQQYQELFFAYQQLPKVKFDAAPATLNNILKYSQQPTLETH